MVLRFYGNLEIYFRNYCFATITAIWRPVSPARCEKNDSLSHLVQDGDTETRPIPASVACSAISDLMSTLPGRLEASPVSRALTSADTS